MVWSKSHPLMMKCKPNSTVVPTSSARVGSCNQQCHIIIMNCHYTLRRRPCTGDALHPVCLSQMTVRIRSGSICWISRRCPYSLPISSSTMASHHCFMTCGTSSAPLFGLNRHQRTFRSLHVARSAFCECTAPLSSSSDPRGSTERDSQLLSSLGFNLHCPTDRCDDPPL
jgi:hypothetical protein